MHFGPTSDSVKTSQLLAKPGHEESAVQNLKLKLYPLLIAAVGVIAASGGYMRTR